MRGLDRHYDPSRVAGGLHQTEENECLASTIQVRGCDLGRCEDIYRPFTTGLLRGTNSILLSESDTPQRDLCIHSISRRRALHLRRTGRVFDTRRRALRCFSNECGSSLVICQLGGTRPTLGHLDPFETRVWQVGCFNGQNTGGWLRPFR